jgi:hypothetical protein
MKKYWLEIMHRPFEDGTPRHPLISIEVPKDLQSSVSCLIEGSSCETNGGFDYWEFHPGSSYHKQDVADLFMRLGITGSPWVEYFIKEGPT